MEIKLSLNAIHDIEIWCDEHDCKIDLYRYTTTNLREFSERVISEGSAVDIFGQIDNLMWGHCPKLAEDIEREGVYADRQKIMEICHNSWELRIRD